MVYQGSKARLVRYIAPILQKCIADNNINTYVEPFVGGANMIIHIKCANRIGSDNNAELIALLNYMETAPAMEIFPEECSKEHYADVRECRKQGNNKYSMEYTAGIGYFASYGGRYFDGGYGRDSKEGRSIYAERLRNAKNQAPLLEGIAFFNFSYERYLSCKDTVFYLDPPYKGTKGYNSKFNYDEFYDFCRALSKNNFVFISEYSMPDDFECIWCKDVSVTQKSDRIQGDKATEKLFVWKGGRR